MPEINYDKIKNKFDYLHDNIEDDKLNNPVLSMMPILKNITKKNLIPIIDFEEFNKAQKNLAVKAAPSFTLNYLTVYLT